jgi:tetratricopeptide (TPR) repeat protein
MRLGGWTRLAGLAAALLVLAPGGATAQRPTAPAEVLRQARDLFEAGRRLYNIGRYDEAIDSFKAAYVRSSAPLLLYNIAQAHRAKGDCAEARRVFDTYLREDPKADRAEVEARMVTCKARQGDPEPQADLRLPSSPSDAARQARVGGPQEPSARGGRGLRLSGLAAGSVGVALIGTGIYFGVRASSKAGAVADYRGEWGAEQKALEQAGERAGVLAAALLGTGAAALVAGGVLYYLGYRRAERPRSTMTLAPVRGGSTLVWTCAY